MAMIEIAETVVFWSAGIFAWLACASFAVGLCCGLYKIMIEESLEEPLVFCMFSFALFACLVFFLTSLLAWFALWMLAG